MLVVSILGGLINLFGVFLFLQESLKLCQKKESPLPKLTDPSESDLADTENSTLADKPNENSQPVEFGVKDPERVNLNIIGLFWHMLADTMGSLVAVISSI